MFAQNVAMQAVSIYAQVSLVHSASSQICDGLAQVRTLTLIPTHAENHQATRVAERVLCKVCVDRDFVISSTGNANPHSFECDGLL